MKVRLAMLKVRTMKHAFSVEMNSKNQVKNISISNEAHDRVLFEGNIGQLLELSLVESNVLEFIGTKGVLRVAVTEEQLRNALRASSQVKPQLRGGEL